MDRPHSATSPTPTSGTRHALVFASIGLLLSGAAMADARVSCPTTAAPLQDLSDLRDGIVSEGEPVVAEGIASGVFMDEDELGGFYLQQSTGKEATGLFVYAPRQTPVRPGQRLQVHGEFNRHHERPQISHVNAVHSCGYEGRPEPIELHLPEDAHRLETFSDLKVRFPQTLTVTSNRELARYGTLTLAADGRLRHPGQTGQDTGPSHRNRTIELDDGSYRAQPDPIPYLDEYGTRRTGSTVEGLKGILTHAFGRHRIHPTATPAWNSGERPDPPPAPALDRLRIATANLENDFVTLGERGASNPSERERQTAKLDALIHALNADLLAAVELENATAAREGLLERLNASTRSRGEYSAIAHPAPGTDAIKVALLYRPEQVRLLDTTADEDPVHHRPPLLGWFEHAESELRFGAVAVHFKAKSGCPDSGDIDRGQGCWNLRRTEQAERLIQWIEEQQRGEFSEVPVLILGDLNAYAAEDPLQVLHRAGKRDLVHSDPTQAYSYVFRGKAGQLDYLLGPAPMHERVQDGDTWRVNADEPVFLGFDGRRPADGPWRASDHDPVWVDLNLDTTPRPNP
ncbi:ExeM/NucH family extracellular endonuclease [Thioalkalivibrio sp. ALJ7]|uniref:ExeM/NucH family extracellular endonuclease n=1 Tax=Thioalkalivibrio sp. ALJ7 TaxID=1158756 RepID=UPI000373354E|nr:ExeM/NucH family extracellular endonuclease [Thioalkalivibrio sp. ALJ7]